MIGGDLIRDSLRPLMRRRGVTFIIVLTLALGVGVNAGIFSVFQQVLLQKLPVPQPERLFALTSTGPKQGAVSTTGSGGNEYVFSYSTWRDLRALDAGHRGIAGHRNFGANLSFDGQTVSATGAFVTANYFETLALAPSLGRLFSVDDFTVAGEGEGVVLSHRYWQRSFGEDPQAIGQTLIINGRSMEIVGVAPPRFVGLNRFNPVDVFVPVTLVEQIAPGAWQLEPRLNYWLYLVTRLDDGADASRVVAALESRYLQLVRDYDAPLLPEVSDEWRQRFLTQSVELKSIAGGQSRTRAAARAPLTLLLAVTALVLLVACVNIANLLLALALSDRGETAVRMALGAGRRNVMARQILQLTALGVCGALASVPVAAGTLRVVLGLLPDPGQTPLNASLDWGLLMTAIGISMLAVALAGLAPLAQAFGSRPIAAIREQSGRSGGSRFSSRVRSGLVTGQIALALALLTVSGLFIQSLVNVSRVDMGMNIERVVTFTISPARNGYDADRSKTLLASLEARLNQLPGVASASISLVPLLSDSNWNNSVSVEGFDASLDTDTTASFTAVGSRFFETLGIPLLKGRVVSDADIDGRPRIALVNRAFVEKFEMGDEVIGKRMAQSIGNDVELDIEIVGVVADASYSTIKDDPPPQFFLPMWQNNYFGSASFYIRTQGEPDALMQRVQAVVAEFDANLPVVGLATLKHSSRQTIVIDRLMGTLAALFAGLATVLAAIGLFGVLSFTTAQRSSELGLRGALGASPAELRRMVLMHAIRLGVVGGAIGIVIAFALGRLASGLLFGIASFSVSISIAASAILFCVVLVSGWLPARRAARIHPVQALRYE